jgi:hypothetical protein
MNRLLSASNRLAGAAAALVGVVCVIHLQDQSWFAFHKSPGYVQIGYVLLELTCLVVAGMLLLRPVRGAWLLALGCGIGPFVGYVLSRGPGLPLYRDDIGNWTEPLGIVSLVVEGLLIALALTALSGATRRVSTMRAEAAEAAA